MVNMATTIKSVINYNELKNFGSLSRDELKCAMYKAVYGGYPIDCTAVFYFTTPEAGLSFDLMAMWLGKLPFLGRTSDGAVDEFSETLEKIDNIPQKECYGQVDAVVGSESKISGRNSIMRIEVDDKKSYNRNNTKYKVYFKAKDLGKFFDELEPVMIMDEHYFINYENKTLYNFSIKWHNYSSVEFSFTMLYGKDTDIAKEIEFFNSYFEVMETEEREPNTFYYLYKTQHGLTSQSLEMDFYDITDEFIEKNYNNDIPYGKIENFINGDDSGICLLHGDPGTGKSTFIKHLIGKYTGSNFFYIPSSLMMQLDENELANYILQSAAKSIYIIEDCEALISDRNKNYNPILPTLLNFSDGIVGGSLKPKFILTFNCPISQIDKAILRKGRLKIKYDFKPLCLEKTKLLYPEATGPMPLCDIYNREDNGTEDNGKKRIGF